MSGKVFISCGQATELERKIASDISNWFQENGFIPYVAIQAQSIQDVNSSIIDRLRNSDFYVFIDFKREKLISDAGDEWRGSLFTNQELAIAYILGFENVVFLQEEGVRLEGLLKYMASNATKFADKNDVPEFVRRLVIDRGWQKDYTRHLIPSNLRWSNELLTYRDLIGKFLYIDIENRRPDLGAFNTIARLSFITNPDGQRYLSPNRSHLKTTGQPGYVQIIWPESHGAFDLLCVSHQNPNLVYLNNALDVVPTPHLIEGIGLYKLEYEVYALGFPILRFTVDLELTGDLTTTSAQLQRI